MALHDFLNSVPYPLTAVLVKLAPCLSFLRRAAQIVTWSSSWYDGCLAVAAWWSICLFADVTFRYFLPFALLAVSFLIRRWSTNERTNPPPITEIALQDAIADLNAIQAFLPDTQPLRGVLPSTNMLVRVCTLLYVPYLVVTYFIPLRVIVALGGTVALCWQAPWTLVLRSAVQRSAWCRWGAYYTWSFLSNQPLPPRSAPTRIETFNAAPEDPANTLRFLFTIYENQRWWMGLDFTAALLPSERPSWSTQSGQPVPPPNLFTLPEDTVVYLRNHEGKRVKRTATWRWEEPEWTVLVKSEDGSTNRVERPLPSTKEESTSTGLLMKKMKEMNQNSNAASSTSGNSENDNPVDDGDDEEHDVTDVDGWIYGDNKWEGKSSKGGMGKYTRHRRWTRVAIVIEVVETVEDGEIGIERSGGGPTTAIISETRRGSTDSDKGSPLRQRLQSALAKGTQHKD